MGNAVLQSLMTAAAQRFCFLFLLFVIFMTLCFDDLVFLYLAVQRSAADAESECGLCLVAAVFFQCFDDHFALTVIDRTAERVSCF